MKKGLLLLMTLMVSICSYAASDFWQEGKRWVVDQNYPEELAAHTDFFVEGDSIYNNRHCKIIYSQNQRINIHRQFYALGYQEGDKVYCFYGDSEKPELLYDFSLKENDIFNYAGEISCRVEKIDYVISCGKTYKRWHFEDIETHEKVGNWIEDIGSIGGPLFPFRFTGNQFSLRSCFLNEELLFFINDVKEKKAEGYLVEGRTWNYRNDYTKELFSITVNGDSLFEGKQCKILEYTSNGQTKLAGYAYETEDKRIFIYNLLDLERCDFMHEGWLETNNFGLSVGDSINFRTSLGYDGTDKVDYIDTIIVNNKMYRRWNMKRSLTRNGVLLSQDKKVTRAIVDGIGNAFYTYTGNNKYYKHSAGIYSQYGEYHNGTHATVLLSVYDGDKCVFNADDFVKEASLKTANPHTLAEDRSWKYKKYLLSDNVEFSITVGGDTIFDDRWCKKLLYSDENGKSLAGMAYETEDGKVNIYNTLQLDNAVFLHKGWMCTNDFGLEQGDKVPYVDEFDEIPYIVGKVDSIDVKGSIRKRWYAIVKGTEDNVAFTVAEGIGNDKYGIYAYCSLEPDSYPLYSFVSCYQGDSCIFEASDYNLVSIDNKNGNAFLVDGRSWRYKQTAYDEAQKEFFEKDFMLSIKGDAIFKDIVCKKIYYYEGGQTELYGYAYQNETKVYFYFLKDIENFCSPSTDWELIFDFDKKEKEIFGTSFPAFLVEKDSIEVKGNTYQRYWIGPKHDGKIIKLYPVIYSIGGFRGLHNNDIEGGNSAVAYSCMSVYDNDKCIFEQDDFFVNPMSYNNIVKGRRWDYVYDEYLYVYNSYTGVKIPEFTKIQPYSLVIGEDTVVAGRECKKLYHKINTTNYVISASKYVKDTLCVPNAVTTLHGYIQETSDSVMVYVEKEIEHVSSPDGMEVPETGAWVKIYDYTMPSGAYCSWLNKIGWWGYYMLHKEEIVIRDKTYNCYLLYGDYSAKWRPGTKPVIEGIGCGGLYFSPESDDAEFIAAYDGEECLFDAHDNEKLKEKYLNKYAAVIAGKTLILGQLNTQQEKEVTHLWVWGKLLEIDYETLKNNYLPKLDYLNLSDADIDTLQAEAFDITLPESNASPKYIVLPKKLKHISDNALCVYPNITTYEVTGAYPSLGKDVYSRKGKKSNHIFVVPSIDNKYLTLHTIDPTGGSSGPGRVPIKRLAMVDDDSIYGSSVMSKGGDTLYYVNASKGKGYAVANGMKTIAANAMENKLLENAFNIPETVDSIGNRVFNGLRIVETRSNAPQYYLACYRANPPMIGNEVFDESSLVTGSHVFYVNKESISDYKNTKGWDKLYYGDIDDVSGVEEVKRAKEQSPYYYDLQGRRLINPTKGLYIHNGKKVIVR